MVAWIDVAGVEAGGAPVDGSEIVGAVLESPGWMVERAIEGWDSVGRLNGVEAVSVGAGAAVLFWAIGGTSVGAGACERLVEAGLKMSLEEAVVGTGMDTIEPKGELAFEAAALDTGVTAAELAMTGLAALGVVVAFEGAVGMTVVSANGAASELGVEDGGTTEADIEKPVEVKVAVVVGVANKTVLELRSVPAAEAGVAGSEVVAGNKVEPVGTMTSVSELLDEAVGT